MASISLILVSVLESPTMQEKGQLFRFRIERSIRLPILESRLHIVNCEDTDIWSEGFFFWRCQVSAYTTTIDVASMGADNL